MNLSKLLIFIVLMLSVSACCAEEVFAIAPDIKSPTPPTITADKSKGTISVYWPDTGKTITEPALFGKHHSNELNLTSYDVPGKLNGTTPAGTFPIKKMVSWRLNENMLAFIEGKATIMAIHPLWTGNPDQHRIQRLKSPTPDDNRITQGCINVDATFFYSVLDNLPDGTILTILPE